MYTTAEWLRRAGWKVGNSYDVVEAADGRWVRYTVALEIQDARDRAALLPEESFSERETLAERAMEAIVQGIAASDFSGLRTSAEAVTSAAIVAKNAFRIADAMIKKRNEDLADVLKEQDKDK